MPILPREFYFQDTTRVSKDLLGKILCHQQPDGKVVKGRIVETEAYLGIQDRACHTFGGRRTKRTESMYLEGGHSYIYLIYGMYYCLNVVTRTSKYPEAVLIRALEPLTFVKGSKVHKTELHTNGPGKLCRFLGLNKTHDGLELWTKKSGLWIEDAPLLKKSQIVKRPRIGVDYAGEAAAWDLRFYDRESLYVSRK